MAEYGNQLNNTRWYQAQFGWAKWVSILDLKADFHNILFEHASSFYSTFVTYWGKFQWIKIPRGLTLAPAYF